MPKTKKGDQAPKPEKEKKSTKVKTEAEKKAVIDEKLAATLEKAKKEFTEKEEAFDDAYYLFPKVFILKGKPGKIAVAAAVEQLKQALDELILAHEKTMAIRKKQARNSISS